MGGAHVGGARRCLPSPDRLVREPGREASTLARGRVVGGRVGGPVLPAAGCGGGGLAQREGQAGLPGSVQGQASCAEPVPDAAGQRRAGVDGPDGITCQGWSCCSAQHRGRPPRSSSASPLTRPSPLSPCTGWTSTAARFCAKPRPRLGLKRSWPSLRPPEWCWKRAAGPATGAGLRKLRAVRCG